jgi:hypothetical protein
MNSSYLSSPQQKLSVACLSKILGLIICCILALHNDLSQFVSSLSLVFEAAFNSQVNIQC